ncbi:uncharacterized protein [Palaemon carinicauda]|uniref:uncharacterized protein n=1 Tax=Palaemon carinicauda TaxID=392227 RepID=UPI0035B690A3
MKGSVFFLLILASLLMTGYADLKEEQKKEEEEPVTPFIPIPPPLSQPIPRRRSGGYGKRSIPDEAIEAHETQESQQNAAVAHGGLNQPSLQFQPFAPATGSLPSRRRSGGYGK